MTKTPRITTFAATKSQLLAAIKSGADHIILEDSKLSTRSFSDDFSTPNFNKISQLSKLARGSKKSIELSFNLNLLPKNQDYPKIKQLLKTLKESDIKTIRIQDPGLAILIKKEYPEATLYLAAETTNLNPKSTSYYATAFPGQTLGNELTHQQIKKISQTTKSELEIQAHGPMLIQQSLRRFISGQSANNTKTYNPDNHPPLKRTVIDQDHPKKKFTFYENPHGNFILNYFDRCLIKHIPKLVRLNLTSWLIDARGESDQYLATAITIYQENLARYLNNPNQWKPNQDDLASLKKVATRPLKPGFFLKNKTDQILRKIDTLIPPEDQTTFVGIVIDSIRNHKITIELHRPISLTDTLLLVTPEGKQVYHQPKKITDLLENNLKNSNSQTLIQIKWLKGIVPKTRVYISS
jgi:U32 family peptidase